ncbi:uroporphyrinogen-III C-methyltransferase [Pirellulales bacterium]|nr:uroporphyrinogen-III C-methyltransferase [Pirellulales bacterium]
MKSLLTSNGHLPCSPLEKEAGCTVRNGHVLFVGAGPGQADLLTVRATRSLECADVVVYDTLVSPAVLNLIKHDAQKISLSEILGGSTGKDVGRIIGNCLATYATNNRNVVRLKGGDPTIFARLREEIEPLNEQFISFEIIPGITSATAAAAAAGTPLTSRNISSSLTIVTGHEAKEKQDTIDYEKLSIQEGTVVIYMGVDQVRHWSDALLKAGRASDTPVTFVSRCSWPDQRIIQTTLAACAADIDSAQLPSPAVAVIGETPLRNPYHDDVKLPLQGCRVLVTRPAGQADSVIAEVTQRGGEAMHLPLIEIVPATDTQELKSAITEAWSFDWIVFTSVNGVDHFCRELRLLGRDPRALGTARIAAIGPATATALENYGFVCDLIPDRYLSEGFVAAFKQDPDQKRFLLIQAERGRDVLRKELIAAGHEVRQVAAYATRATTADQHTAIRMIEQFPVTWILLTSSFIAETAVKIFGSRLHSWKIASISPITSSKLTQLGYPVTTEASEPTMTSLLDSIESWQSHRAKDSRCQEIPAGTTMPPE